MFEADLESAVAAAREKSIVLRSIVFPRNQHNPQYDAILAKHGVVCYRGNQKARMYQFDRETLYHPYYRATRLADTFVNWSGFNTIRWRDVWNDQIANVPASIFLRPVSGRNTLLEMMQLRRISRSLTRAARRNEIFHLWWHPHNFGKATEANVRFLRRILDRFRKLQRRYAMQSLSMAEAAQLAAPATVEAISP
jgi:hypothetical protein